MGLKLIYTYLDLLTDIYLLTEVFKVYNIHKVKE